MSDGLAEIIKYGLIYDRDFFVWLQSNVSNILEQDRSSLGHAVQRSCQIKAEIVAQDEKEQSIRAILNFGHTFGHAIENQAGYGQWSHGQAIAAGMVLASKLSAKMSLISEDDVEVVKDILLKAGLPVEPPKINVNDFMDTMRADKKVKDRVIQLVLLEEIGNAFLTADYLEQDLEDVLKGVI
jgi:3-dehydroquinate synthase